MRAKSNWPEGIRRTACRERVLDVIERSDAPLSAAEIFAKLSASDIWLSTVYRALETFTEKGVIAKTPSPGGDTALYVLSGGGHVHYAVCLRCHRAVKLNICPIREEFARADAYGFRVLGHNVELFGYCDKCETGR